ncbi:MAG TPA: PASTA domain-containing protein [Candidatus Onthovicinus excrementipullorum]|nr:PASTA domain-containing protein [Candidatus Onthovicinus excrementipullorum]
MIAKRSMAVALAIIFAGFGAGVVSLARIQLIHGEEYKEKARMQQLSDTTISPQRGTIYDCNGEVLGESATAWQVYIVPSKIETDEQMELTVEGLSTILEMDAETVRKKASQSQYNYVSVKEGVENDTKNALAAFIDEHREDQALHTIIGFDPDTKRYYPYNNFASSVIGFTGSDDEGRAGLELQYNEELTGTPGRIITAKDGAQDDMANQYESTYDAKQGDGLVLTIDRVIQYYLEKSLKQAYIDTQAKSTYGIVMDVDTGAILAMATLPDYNLNEPRVVADASVQAKLDAIQDESERSKAEGEALYSQWRNRAISDTYEPGSVFKIFVAAAALEENAVTLDTTYTCTGSITPSFRNKPIYCSNHAGHGTENFTQGLMNSCNPFFVTVGLELGTEKFYQYYEAFGFTEKTGIDLPAEAAPVAGVTYYAKDKFTVSDLASSSFGQTFQVSSIQMITAACAIGNGGKLMQPYIVKARVDADGNTIAETKPTVKRQVISEKVSQEVLGMMEQVVRGGTGRNGYVAGYRVAGKTGTSEKLSGTDASARIASFVGMAPANDPKIAVLIVVDEPKGQTGGGAVAAPVAAEVIENTMNYLNIEPQYTEEELATLDLKTPTVTNLSVSEAKQKIEAEGLTPKVIGDGDTVSYQMPEAGQTIAKNGVVVLYTEQDSERSKVKVPDLSNLSVAEASRRALNAGLNIRIAGITSGEGIVSYRQSIDKDTEVEAGTIITVYFKTNTNIDDLA